MHIHINEIRYYNEQGEFLWNESMIYRRLFMVGQEIIENYKTYKVLRVAVAEGIQYVNLKEVKVKGEL